jgi:hypothetical protein
MHWKGIRSSVWLLMALLCSCGKGGKPSGSGFDFPIRPAAELGARVDASLLQCDSDSNCSPAVALLSIGNGIPAQQCMASLVDNELLVTASHCLPEDLRRSGAQCRGTVHVHFPSFGNYPELRADCEEILAASTLIDRTRAQPDIAFIKLAKPVNRPPFVVDHSGFDRKAKFSVLQTRVNPDAATGAGKIISTACRPILGSEALPGSSRPESSVVALADCTLETLSDGAPILDANGKLRGVLQSRVPPTRISKRIGSNRLLEPELAPLSLATNFACFRLPRNDTQFSIPMSCQDDPNEPSPQFDKSRTDSLLSRSIQLTDEKFKWPVPLPGVRWATRSFLKASNEGQALATALGAQREMSLYSLPVPRCASNEFASAITLNPESEPLLQATSFYLPIVGFTFALDRYLILRLDSGTSLGSIPARLEIDAIRPVRGEMSSNNSRHANVFINARDPSEGGSENWIRILRTPLPTCMR